jgi:hypothetical protein
MPISSPAPPRMAVSFFALTFYPPILYVSSRESCAADKNNAGISVYYTENVWKFKLFLSKM